jgi:hypothetical protein
LGDIDYRIQKIEELKGDLPEKVESQKQLIVELNLENEKNDNKISEIDHDIKDSQYVLDDTNEKLNKYKNQLYLVTTNKEYDALLTEIDHSKDLLNKTQKKFDLIIDLKEKLTEALKSNKIKLEETNTNLIECESELKDTLKESKDEYLSLGKKRESLEVKIETRFLSLYNRMRKGRRGMGIISVHKNACGSCYNVLPPQTVIEIRKAENIMTCHTCGIILFWENED